MSRQNPARIGPDGHRDSVGGLWEEVGRLQFEYLVAEGLLPHHRLLDVGCGSLRGGVHFVRYLNPGHYYGLDANPSLLEGGRTELENAGLSDRRVTLRATDSFEIDSASFDYALAVSLFTHLPLNSIRLCFVRVAARLTAGGRFYATYFPAGDDPLEPIHRYGWWPVFTSSFDRDPYHYEPADLEWAARGTGLQMTDLGAWNHPRGQEMLLFARDGE